MNDPQTQRAQQEAIAAHWKKLGLEVEEGDVDDEVLLAGGARRRLPLAPAAPLPDNDPDPDNGQP